jgi:hypothetical protein
MNTNDELDVKWKQTVAAYLKALHQEFDWTDSHKPL